MIWYEDERTPRPPTARQLEIAALLMAGYTFAAIAEQLCLSEYTIRNHMYRPAGLLARMNAHTLLHACTLLVAQGYIRLRWVEHLDITTNGDTNARME